jgi:hypothetical protein
MQNYRDLNINKINYRDFSTKIQGPNEFLQIKNYFPKGNSVKLVHGS